MMSVQFICANTRYNEMSQPFLRLLARGLKDRYKLRSWSTTWGIVREYGPDILKTLCLLDAGAQIPNFVPYSGVAVPIPGKENEDSRGGGEEDEDGVARSGGDEDEDIDEDGDARGGGEDGMKS